MKIKRKAFGFLFLLFCLAAIAVVAFMMVVVDSVTKVTGKAGEQLSFIDTLQYSLRLYSNLDQLKTTTSFSSLKERKFTIEETNNAADVCEKLENEQFVTSSSLTCDYLIYKGFDRTLSPGTYTIDNGLNVLEISDFIADSSNRDIQFTIFEGWRLEEIANMLDQISLSFSGEEFLNFAFNPPENIQNNLLLLAGQSLEGHFFPGNYSLRPKTTLEEFAAESFARFSEAITDSKSSQEEQSSAYSDYEILTIASIIQRETLAVEEMPLIASVIYNRLAIGMKLETDPTVQYGIAYVPEQQTWWKSPLNLEDLSTNSAYNTYQVYGLPPGPICSPGKDALQAAFTPAESSYFFFRAKCDGSLTHNFAETFEEHLLNGCD